MKGVEILSTIEVVTKRSYDWATAILICIVFLFLGLAVGVIRGAIGELNVKEILYSSFIGMLFGIIITINCTALLIHPSEYETQYKVTISDEASLIDFADKYEIVDTEGKIFIIREIEKGE